uniref:phosphoethanolamine N-methyltransferase n=1 Tax=Mucochytrium quahogii TaxID=96639 RepID=A0A7S2SDW5_9STRA|mmetsp:Transcript_13961/g.22813  ORF Transcript_13961/g.22813 Transcript_13961/m.22813 type:complete len:304 (+) Transcript_13961:63-974(+)
MEAKLSDDERKYSDAQLEGLPIKSMNLYKNSERLYNELKGFGVHDDLSNLTTELVCSIPSLYLNYCGNQGVEKALSMLEFDTAKQYSVVDIGCGYGGPARSIVSKVGNVSIVGYDIQEDIVKIASKLSEQTVGASKCKHVCKNFLHANINNATVDIFVSWLTILHFTKNERRALWEKVYSSLKPGGKMYVEDYFCTGPSNFSKREIDMLSNFVYCDGKTLPTENEYKQQISSTGLVVKSFENVSSEWTEFVKKRWKNWVAQKELLVQTHGERVYNNLLVFYETVYVLFEYGNLQGCRVLIVKP